MLKINTKHQKNTKEWKKTMKALLENDAQTKLDELTKSQNELKEKKSAIEEVELAIKHQFGAQRERNRLEDDANAEKWTKAFKETWQTDGWGKKAQDFYKDYQNNIYKIKISNTDYETTEEQIINTVARVVKSLEKIDAPDFIAKYNAKESDAGKQKKIKDALDIIQAHSKEIVVGSDKDTVGETKQPTYDFSNTYLKGKFEDNGKWKADSATYSAPAFDYQTFGEFIALVAGQDFLNNLDADKQKEVPQTEDWKIFLKGTKWSAEKLKDYGIIINESKTSLYQTDHTKSQTFKVEGGVKGWILLAQAVLPKANYEKIHKNFTDANNPNQLLLQDGKTYDPSTGNWMLPESVDAIDDLIVKLETLKLSKASSVKPEELKVKESEVTQKEQELEGLIKTALANQRKELKKLVPDLAKGKTFKKVSDSEDYRQTVADLREINQLLLKIRYLENQGDCTADSSLTDENEALTNVEVLIKEVAGASDTPLKIWLYDISSACSKEEGTDSTGNKRFIHDNATGIAWIKRVHNADPYTGLNQHKEALEWFANKVKLTESEQSFLEAIKKELGETPTPQNAPEKLTDWQTDLKALDKDLEEAVITSNFKTEWEKIAKFKKRDNLKALLKLVIDTTDSNQPKTKEGFLTLLKTTESKTAGTKINNLKTLMGEEPKKVIILIKKYDLVESKSAEEKIQNLRRLAVLAGKKSTDAVKTLTDAELDNILYEIGVGTKTFSTAKSYNEDLTEITIPSPDNGENNNETESAWWQKAGYWPFWTGGVLIIAGVLAYVYWESIANWWNGPAEEAGEAIKISEDDE